MTTPARDRLKLVATAVGITVVSMSAVCLLTVLFDRPSPPSAPSAPPQPVDPETTPLRQTVLYKSRLGFPVCTRQPLHRCTVTFVTDASGEPHTIVIGPVDIAPVESCEGMASAASEACERADAGPINGALPWIRCAAQHGVVAREPGNVRTVDPRDAPERRRPGWARLRCDEGFVSGSFDDTL